MKHHIRTLACGAALLVAVAAVACGGKQTMASKSAAAYDEAKKKGIPIEAGEHGGHSATPAGAATASMPGMDHSAMAGMDHSKMGMKAGTPGAGAHDMAGMDRSKMPGMQHGGTMAAAGGMQHGSQPAAPIAIAPPTSNAAIAQTQPAATLRPDEFDAPAPTAIEEAAKSASPPAEHHHHGGGEAS
jgi:uncharacterized protein involved in copper resistance